MAEKHYVDAKDQHIAAEGAPTHSELTTMYREARKEKLGRWMQEDERQAVMDKERNDVIISLRKPAVAIGFFISLPVVLGVLLGQLAMTHDTFNKADLMAFEFLLLFLLAGLLGLTYRLFKWVGEVFRDHTLRASPITLTTLLSLFLLVRPTLHLVDMYIGGPMGYGVGLSILLAIGTLIATISIFIWTAVRIPALIKILILILFFGGAVATAYLA